MELFCWVRNRISIISSFEIDRILIVQLANIGDAVLTTPVISTLSNRYPEAIIHVITGSENSLVFENNNNVDCIHYVDSGKYIRHNTVSGSSADLYDRLTKSRYDLVIVIRADSTFLKYLLKGDIGRVALYRMKYHPQRRMWMRYAGLSRRSPTIRHNVELINDSIQKIGINLGNIIDAKAGITLPASVASELESLLAVKSIEKDFLVFHVNTPFIYRKWPEDRFAQLIDHAINKWGIHCLLIGGKNDIETTRTVISLCCNRNNVTSFAGEINLAVTAALIKKAKVYVGNDSGPMHIAAAMGTPVLAFFGPQTPALFAPWKTKSRILSTSRNCSPCWQRGCITPDNYCMMDISVKDAVQALDNLILEER